MTFPSNSTRGVTIRTLRDMLEIFWQGNEKMICQAMSVNPRVVESEGPRW